MMINFLIIILIISLSANIFMLLNRPVTSKKIKSDMDFDVIENGIRHVDKRISAMTALLTLSARVTKADGKILQSETAEAMRHLGLMDVADQNQGLFEAACASEISDEELVKVIKQTFTYDYEIKNVTQLLMNVAKADGEIHPTETTYMDKITALLYD